MSKMKFELNRKGVAQLMKSSEMQDVLEDYAADIAIRAGADYDYDIHVGRNRANSKVRPITYEGRVDNMKNNTLLKAMK